VSCYEKLETWTETLERRKQRDLELGMSGFTEDSIKAVGWEG
jgi:hypothetical protein